MKKSVIVKLFCMLLIVTGVDLSAGGSDVLRYNPFEQPDANSGWSHRDASKMVETKMILRGTVMDGNDSLVNISGKFYRLNQDVSGYRITNIKGTSVLLKRGNNEMVLMINDGQ